MEKEDRNTLILISIVLIVCIISLIAIFTIIWRIIGPTVVDGVEYMSEYIRGENTNYNFEVPEYEGEVVAEVEEDNEVEEVVGVEDQDESQEGGNDQPEVQPEISDDKVLAVDPNRVYDYNFTVPADPNPVVATTEFQSFPDAIVQDAILAGYGTGESQDYQVNLQLKIPKIGVNSPVLQGVGGDALLEKGFWIHPASYTLGKGEVVMLCHRRFFGPYDPRSCWFVDKLAAGDEILLDYYDATLKYKVVSVNVFEGEDPLIYNINPNNDYIKIVTCTPLYSNSHRLVVLAERVG